jgi:hypothetical protein
MSGRGRKCLLKNILTGSGAHLGLYSGILSVRSPEVKQPVRATDLSTACIGEVKIEKPNVLLPILQDIHIGISLIFAFMN